MNSCDINSTDESKLLLLTFFVSAQHSNAPTSLSWNKIFWTWHNFISMESVESCYLAAQQWFNGGFNRRGLKKKTSLHKMWTLLWKHGALQGRLQSSFSADIPVPPMAVFLKCSCGHESCRCIAVMRQEKVADQQKPCLKSMVLVFFLLFKVHIFQIYCVRGQFCCMYLDCVCGLLDMENGSKRTYTRWT